MAFSRTINSTLLQPGAVRTSPSVTPGANFKGATISLVDTNGQWNTTTGNVVRWGLQSSNDGGANWDWFLYQDAIPYGTRDRSGGMPALEITSSDFVGGSGTQLRLAIQVDATIRLGAQIAGA